MGRLVTGRWPQTVAMRYGQQQSVGSCRDVECGKVQLRDVVPLLTVTTHVFESGFEFRSNAAVLFLHTVCETNEVCEQVDAGLIHVRQRHSE